MSLLWKDSCKRSTAAVRCARLARMLVFFASAGVRVAAAMNVVALVRVERGYESDSNRKLEAVEHRTSVREKTLQPRWQETLPP